MGSSCDNSLPDYRYSYATGYHHFYGKLKSKPETSFDAKRRILVSCKEFDKTTRNDNDIRECAVSMFKLDRHETVVCHEVSRNPVTGDAVQIDEVSLMSSLSLFKPKNVSTNQHDSIVKSTIEKLVKWDNRDSVNSQNIQIDMDDNGDLCPLEMSDENRAAFDKPDLGSIKHIGHGLACLYYENDLRWRLLGIRNRVRCPRFHNVLPFVVTDCSRDAISLCDLDSEVLSPVGWKATNVQAGSNLTFISQVFSVVFEKNAAQTSHVLINYPDQLVTLKHMRKDGLMTDEEYKMEFGNFISTLRNILRDREPSYAKTCTIFEGHHLEEHIQEFYQNLQKGNDLTNDDGIQSDLEEDGVKSESEVDFCGDDCKPVLTDCIVVSTDTVSDEWILSEIISNPVIVDRNTVTPLTRNMIVASLKQNCHVSDETVKLLTDEGTRTSHQQTGVLLQVLLFLINSVVLDYTLLVKSFNGIRQRAESSREINEEREVPAVSNSTVPSEGEPTNLKHEKFEKAPTKLLSENKRPETRSQIIANILFKMIGDKEYFPYDFEGHLRTLVFEMKQDAAKLRNSDGLSLLHAITVYVRPQFLPPLFRTGCWSGLRTLSAGRGPHEGKTAEDLCVGAKSRKLQKEMDTYTKWEKSLNQVHISARNGDSTEFKRLIRFSEDLHHEVDDMGCTSLYWAVVGGNVDILKMLLNKKVDHMKVNLRKETLLHVACMIGHTHLLTTLVKDLKMDMTVKDASKKSALLRIAENGDEKSLAKLIKCGLKKEKFGQMLAIAGHYGRLGFIKKLIDDFGTDPGSKDDAGKTAFMRACEQSKIDVAKYLLSRGVNIAETDVRRRNVLHMAADGAAANMMEFLLSEIEKKDGRVLKQMLNHRDKYIGGELCMLIRGKDKGRDSWHYVEVSRGLMDIFMKKSRSGSIDVAKYGSLLHSGWGVDPDEESTKEIERRFETRRNAQLSEDLDVTPLHIAAFKDKVDVAEVLMNHGSDINGRDKFGLTPLHIAAMRGNLPMVKSMMKRGAVHDALDNLVKTPVDVAEDNEHGEVANFIRSCQHVPVTEDFRDRVLPNIQRLFAEEHIQQLLDSGFDIRAHLINTLRDLSIDINESLLALGSGPVLEESSAGEYCQSESKE